MRFVKLLRFFGLLGNTRGPRLGQSNLIQLILFIIIGVGLYIGIGNFYRMEYDILREDTANISLEMVNGYLSSIVVASVNSCLQCGSVENNVRISDTTAGYFLEILLNSSGLVVSTAPPEKGYIYSINNLNNSFASIEGSAPSIQPINLTYDRNQNRLEIK